MFSLSPGHPFVFKHHFCLVKVDVAFFRMTPFPAPARRFRNKWGNPSEDPWRPTDVGERIPIWLGQSSLGILNASQDAKVLYKPCHGQVFSCVFRYMMVNSLRQHDLKAQLFSTVSASKVVREPIKRRPILICTPKLSSQDLGVISRKPKEIFLQQEWKKTKLQDMEMTWVVPKHCNNNSVWWRLILGSLHNFGLKWIYPLSYPITRVLDVVTPPAITWGPWCAFAGTFRCHSQDD